MAQPRRHLIAQAVRTDRASAVAIYLPHQRRGAMIESTESRACKESAPPWVGNPYRLISLGEIIAMLFKGDEVFITPVGNLFFTLGALEVAAKGGTVGQRDMIQFE